MTARGETLLRRFPVRLLIVALLLQPFGARAQEQQNRDKQLQDAQKKIEQLQDASKKNEPWDVEGDHGPTTTVEFDTDGGTWMSCDVSPDGTTIVFELLCDICGMP